MIVCPTSSPGHDINEHMENFNGALVDPIVDGMNYIDQSNQNVPTLANMTSFPNQFQAVVHNYETPPQMIEQSIQFNPPSLHPIETSFSQRAVDGNYETSV